MINVDKVATDASQIMFVYFTYNENAFVTLEIILFVEQGHI